MNKEHILPALDKAEQILFQSGWQPYRVSRKINIDIRTRSHCLIQESQDGGYGSIVLGRRGTSVVKEFFLGSVSQQVLNMIDKKAVWIIN